MEEKLKEKYIFYEEIGSGGSGTVFKAYDRHLQRLAAVKRFPAEDAASGRELGMLKELCHPAFPAVTDYIEEQEYKYLVMEYIEGKNLADYIREHGSVDQERAVKWALELAEALLYLHERKCPVIYRDMKPANIIIDGKEHVRMVDFGTAFLRYQEGEETCAGGTWGYAAPEQFEKGCGRKVDERSDLYGLGATLFHMLTGCDPSRPPFLMQPLRSYDRRLSAELERIVHKATEQEREKRYASVRRMKQELENYGKADRLKRLAQNAVKAVYGAALTTASFFFFRSWTWIERMDGGLGEEIMAGKEYGMAGMFGMYGIKRSAAEGRMLQAAVCILLLCIGKSMVSRWKSRGYRSVRQEKNVLLTVKRGKGLAMALVLGVLAAGRAGSGNVWAKDAAGYAQTQAEEERKLFVIVRNELGQKLLIRYDAEYPLSDTLKLELPLKNFEEGEHYELRLECINRETGAAQSRTFYLKGVEP